MSDPDMLSRENFEALLDKYVANDISPEERSSLLNSIASGIHDDTILHRIGSNLREAEMGDAGLSAGRAADILNKILSSEKQNSELMQKASRRTKILRWSLAAACLGVITFLAFFLHPAGKNDTRDEAEFSKTITEYTNTSAHPSKIKLEDGSFVTLQTGAVVHYEEPFLPDRREVYLDGEAFFQVSKNAARPFLVYSRNIVTHVLGTSFTIKTNKKTGQVEVSVSSGRVEVYENQSPGKLSKKNNGVILLPNQKVTYGQDTHQFISALVDVPLPVVNEDSLTNAPVEDFVFEGTPLGSVLESLERSYGIDIVPETEDIYKCLFTGDISRPDLYFRLDVICQSIGTSYEIKGTKILIRGKGCE